MLQTNEYYPYGFYAFHFLITPKELENILKPYHMIVTEDKVPADYIESPLSELIELYGELYELLISGERLTHELYNNLFYNVRIITELSKYKKEKYYTYDGKDFKKISFYEPYPVFFPVAWQFIPDDEPKPRLFKDVCYDFLFDRFMGFGLCLPKEIKYQTDGELMPVSELEAYSEYTDIKNSIMEFTKPLSIKAYGRQIETDTYISEDVKKHLNNFYFFKHNRITAEI